MWHAWCLHFGILQDLGTILGHSVAQENTLWVPGFDFCDYEWISSSDLESFSGTSDQTCFLVFHQMFLFVSVFFGFESGRSGLEKQGFGVRCIAKTNFSQKSELSSSTGPFSILHVSGWPWDLFS